MTDETNKNPLTIRLTESAVFLRPDGTGRQSCDRDDSRPSMLRGLLTLELAKPTRISSIELELVARTVVSWPEGIGARRIEITEEHKIFHASTVYFRAGNTPTRRHASIGPGAADHTSSEHESYQRNFEETVALDRDVLPPRNRQAERRLSADNSFFQRMPLSYEEFSVAPTPPRSPSVTQSSSPQLPLSPDSMEPYQLQSLGEISDHFDSDLRTRSRASTSLSSIGPSPSLPLYSEPPLSGHSVDDAPESEPSPRTLRRSPMPSRTTSPPPTPPTPVSSTDNNRGRSRSHFSLSPPPSFGRTHGFSESREPSHEDERNYINRGRPQEKGKRVDRMADVRTQESKDRSTFRKIGALFKLDRNDNQAGDAWKEFKKGTYTYPISYAIPANSSPTLQCNYGSVTWRLRATAHRPGAFTSKFVATREVLVINGPTEDDTENHEHIVVERQWDQQLQYLISVSGRSFYIGGPLPIMFTFMPLAKIKLHQIHVFIEERVDFYSQMKRIAHTEPLTRIELLVLRDAGKEPRPILPLESDDEEVLKNSPLYALTQPEDDLSEVVANYLGPGPWTLTSNLKLPNSCRQIHMSNKNRKSNIVITHQLKCILRVERGDNTHVDPKSGKRRLFDITAHIPIQILSCRCNPDWTSLPPYLESFDDASTVMPDCPCIARPGRSPNTHASTPEYMTAGQPSTSSSGMGRSTANPSTLPHHGPLFNRSSQYERLISGQESELGEAPPMYTV